MIEQIRLRPWPIHGFAVIFLGVGLWALIGGLNDIDGWLAQYRNILPQFPSDRDWIIVVLSARFSIVCIPVIAIWCFRSVVARVLVCAFTLVPLMGIIRQLGDTLDALSWDTMAGGGLLVAGCALLYSPSARAWFAPEPLKQEAVFE